MLTLSRAIIQPPTVYIAVYFSGATYVCTYVCVRARVRVCACDVSYDYTQIEFSEKGSIPTLGMVRL